MAIAFEASFPGTPLAVRGLRRAMAGLANDCGMDAEGIAAVRLAVTEAATNAVMHAYADAQGELRVTAAIEDGELTIAFDEGVALAPAAGRAQRQLTTSPAQRAAAEAARHEFAHRRARLVGGLDDPLPEPAAADPPASATRLGRRSAQGEAHEAQRADAR